jgi:beta-lactamase class A
VRLRSSSLYLRGISLLFLLLTTVVTVLQVVQYSLSRADYPPDMTIGGVPVGLLDPQEAAQRILQVFSLPIELHYGQAIIDLDPSLIGFQLDMESMLADADLKRTGASFWSGFWDYLWNRRTPVQQIPLVSTFSESRLREYLTNEISLRYDHPAQPAQPIPGTSSFSPGIPGQTIDIDRAVLLIEYALKTPDRRVVALVSLSTLPGRPSTTDLEILIKQLADQSGFPGLIGLYFRNLQNQEEIYFAYQTGQDVTIDPNIAFSGASTIKIPIMISIFRQNNSLISSDIDIFLQDMIKTSSNAEADNLMASLDASRGPLIVTEIVQELGFKNTFIAMYFAPGSYPLQHYITPANSRTDITTDPDPFIQTTSYEMGVLLEEIYLCAQTGGGTLVAVFPGQITQTGCKQMLQYLESDKLGSLIQGSLPEGTIVAHKHGWDNYENQFSDAAVIYTPGGNYILTIYSYNPVEFQWDVTTKMFGEISRAIYNYMNLPSQ